MKKFSSPVIVVIVAAIISVAWFTWYAGSADSVSNENNEKLRIANDKIRQLEQVEYMMKSLESAVRGYVITGDSGFLYREDYMETHLRAPMENLVMLYRNNPPELRQLDSLKTEVYKKIAFFNYLISATREAPVMAGAMLQTKRGASSSDEVSRLTGNILQKEHLSLDERLSNHWHNRIPYLLSIFGSAICLIFLLSGLFRLYRNIRKAEQEGKHLRTSEEKYRQLIEDAGVTMYTTNRGGFFTYVNNKSVDLTGYKPEELIGKQYSILLDPSQQKELQAFYENQSFEGPEATTFEFPIRRKNGEKIWVEQQAVLVRHKGAFKGYQCIVKDIHQKKMYQLELERANKEMDVLHHRLQSILENTPAVMFIKDIAGKYLLVNRRFEEVFGISSEQIIGKTDKDFPDVLKPEKNAPYDREALLYEMPVEMEESIDTGEGPRYFFITKFPLRDHVRRIYGLCGIATDITERIANEHALIESRKKAEQSKYAQERFMANMSHEIRTPLNGIIGITNLLQQTSMIPEQKEYVDDIKDSANNLMMLVERILDFSQLNAGKLALSFTDFDPRHLIRKVVLGEQKRATAKGLHLELHLDEHIPDHVLGDHTKLEAVLRNLLDNAIKFTEKGHIDLHVRLTGQDHATNLLSFELSDTGIGIPEHMHEAVFQSFSQLHGNNDRRHGGAGLGLALTKQLIQLQEGRISISGNNEGGTTIHFSIPFSKNLFTPSGDTSPLHLKGKQILVAEDNLINQKVARKTLEQAGAAVTIAENGLEALEKLAAGHFDCILMDIQMPEMDGLTATLRIREKGMSIPIIAMTASALKGDRERCLLAGMNDYISKPFIPDELFAKILEALGERDPAFAAFSGPAHGGESTKSFVDLHYLREIADNDPDYLLETLHTFLERTSGILNSAIHSAQQEDWNATWRYARLLRVSLTVVRIFPLAQIMMEVEQAARLKRQLQSILPNLRDAVSVYNQAQETLRQEILQIGKN